MYKLKEIPQKGEIVLAKIKKIVGNGAFVELIEYCDKNNKPLEAFLPIYELKGRVKNIKNHIREGEVVIVQVFDVKGNKIDVSIRRVNEKQRKEKIEFYKREQKAYKIIEDLAKKLNMDKDDLFNKIGYKILEKYGGLYDFFLEVLQEGKKAIKIRVPKKIRDELYELIKERIKLPEIRIEGEIKAMCTKGDGIIRIKRLLGEILKNENIEIVYISAPRYKLIAKGYNAKEIRKNLEKVIEDAKKLAEKEGIEFSFHE